MAGSSAANGGGHSPNRFEIARNGRRVGVVMLARPAYRLGETVTCAVDFTGAEVSCYAVHAALETTERVVDPGLALRSEASVTRVTRRVWAATSEATLFSRRWTFTAPLPLHATPEFVTSGVGLEWKVRLEFVVPVQMQQQQPQLQSQGHGQKPDVDGDGDANDGRVGEIGEQDDGEGQGMLEEEEKRKVLSKQAAPPPASPPQQPHPLLEEISRDDRGGLILVGVENLVCESFEVAVPLRVYGAACNGLERLERDEAVDEGLPV